MKRPLMRARAANRYSAGHYRLTTEAQRPGTQDATMATTAGMHAARSPANISARSLSLELALLMAILRRDEIAVTHNRDR
jgi:hypothetical protein